MITTREELIVALSEGSEIEHGLMVQYLFAALTCKKSTDEGLTAAQTSLARHWEGTILSVAVDEMGHLGTVFKIDSACLWRVAFWMGVWDADTLCGFVKDSLAIPSVGELPLVRSRSPRRP